ncbi:hypothetical protein MPTK1_2g18900 [Marchantia polymorpha subsp. ruderalis]|uniref:Uncharacterized protein n=1 Tax=Marchantia polymorpha TaxID=3197 RepID=A0A2R6W8K9_MARPO|nr:hypothetical protein MARPO_0128s0005 [Marchantia polymorpha]BBN02878.1 hypothetical protein Mp_2g18900 [Marchantia polymorpha subsp. ruderalis]|eukprot:PTQ30181.1 hypothetical protein MARPO_0128s0005 [Marchantia polymorpha]
MLLRARPREPEAKHPTPGSSVQSQMATARISAPYAFEIGWFPSARLSSSACPCELLLVQRRRVICRRAYIHTQPIFSRVAPTMAPSHSLPDHRE